MPLKRPTPTAVSRVLTGDCLDIMRTMQPGSVDLVMCSPPYEAARTYGIDFNLTGQAWVDWCVPRYLECLRVCKGLVAWVVQGQTRQFRWSCAPVLLMADLHRQGIHLRNPPIYKRSGIPGSGGPDWLRSDYEWIICATGGGKLPWSDNTAMGHTPKWAPGGDLSHRMANGRRVNKLHTKTMPNGDMRTQGYIAPARANPGNVISCVVGGGQLGSKLAHGTEAPYPEALAEFFIRSFCPPGGTVLDCFGGSGTTAAVAKRTGRNYISIDIRASQGTLTNRRLAETQEKPS